MIPIAALWLALAIDRWLGEPPARWHPVVWTGCYLGWIGRRIAPVAGAARPRDWRRLAAGTLAWCIGAAMTLAAACGWLALARRMPAWAAVPWLALALKPLLAWRLLHEEVQAVETALGRSLDEGRAQLARLVSRDVAGLDPGQVREAAIESLAENLNDSLVAPLFWFVLFGLPGAACYRFANTADAMWGYRGEREGRDWTWAGRFAARADDVLSWLPARITALLLWLCAAPLQPRPGRAAAMLLREARKTPSPNSGWPMAAMALQLGIHLRKPGVYALHPEGRAPAGADTARALMLATRVAWLAAACATAAIACLEALGPA
ncbi:MAG TPA: adenosylcobinamide-phosphate synthase CbiB [Variovorax sp.]